MVERLPCKQDVESSSLSSGTISDRIRVAMIWSLSQEHSPVVPMSAYRAFVSRQPSSECRMDLFHPALPCCQHAICGRLVWKREFADASDLVGHVGTFKNWPLASRFRLFAYSLRPSGVAPSGPRLAIRACSFRASRYSGSLL